MKLQMKVPLLVMVILVVIGIISGGMVLYFRRKASVDPLRAYWARPVSYWELSEI